MRVVKTLKEVLQIMTQPLPSLIYFLVMAEIGNIFEKL